MRLSEARLRFRGRTASPVESKRTGSRRSPSGERSEGPNAQPMSDRDRGEWRLGWIKRASAGRRTPASARRGQPTRRGTGQAHRLIMLTKKREMLLILKNLSLSSWL